MRRFGEIFSHCQRVREYEGITRRHIAEESRSLAQPYHLVEPLILPCTVLLILGLLQPTSIQIFNTAYCSRTPLHYF